MTKYCIFIMIMYYFDTRYRFQPFKLVKASCLLMEVLTERYMKFDDRKRALVSRLLQYSIVHEVLGIPYDKIIIHRTLEGKPYLINGIGSPFSNFNFNVSHHGDYVGIASDPLCLVGLDIVSIMIPEQTTEHEFMSNFSSYLTALEWKNIAKTGTSEVKLREFYRYWCLKEAFVKATGAGLGFGFHRLEFHHKNWTDISVYIDGIESREWKFSLYKIDERHWASIARGLANGADEQFDASLPVTEVGFIQRTVDQLIQSRSHGAQQNSC
ncbi:L-aminoadipate-semialdehyde dehydrogenase-phosphopantetheinyl transferase-like isoform X1 [Zingiber officinale]|uniref:L-aminoadipate-semialdehyde dehydrogenase-phosphopantetheinyl transferase-like isoform X1 n=1 Tax=Zingiber officinale TaxID=94328 RepID=UPI001C4D745C|nr:L-aminoadipate-semialdehyde dehydrogenase-phosphopantetheinyl transferase-like isoform X1 [Zingiber officinale]